MLRVALLIFGISVLAAGLFLWLTGGVWQPALIWGCVLVLAVLCERWRYRRRHNEEARWQETGERFEDPESGETVEVEYDPATGERRYLKRDRRRQKPS